MVWVLELAPTHHSIPSLSPSNRPSMIGSAGTRARARATRPTDFAAIALPVRAALIVGRLTPDSRARSVADHPRRAISNLRRPGCTTTPMPQTWPQITPRVTWPTASVECAEVTSGRMRVAGADVWKGQWVVVALDDGRFADAFVAPTIEAALGLVPDAAVVGVDMPIGLPEPGQRRPADEQARAFVGPRWPSVFMTPSADLLEAASAKAANELAKAAGREGISAQAYGLGGLILQGQPVAAGDGRIYEVHPEVSFATANSNTHLAWSKTAWNGITLRRQILEAHRIVIPDDLGPSGKAGVADILDAAIAAWSAGRIAAGKAERLPPGQGRIGAIWA